MRNLTGTEVTTAKMRLGYLDRSLTRWSEVKAGEKLSTKSAKQEAQLKSLQNQIDPISCLYLQT